MEMSQSHAENEHLEYVVQINHSDELNLSNFSQYTLISQDETELITNEMTCEIPGGGDLKDTVDEVWQGSLTDDALKESVKIEESPSRLTPGEISMLKEIDKIIKRENGTPPCHGQGDGPNSPLLTSSNVHHSETNDKNQQCTTPLQQVTENHVDMEEDGKQLIYATLEPSTMSCVNYETPRFNYRLQTQNTTPLMSLEEPTFSTYGPRNILTKGPALRGYRQGENIMPPYVVRPPVTISTGNSTDNSSVDYQFTSSVSSSQFEGDKSSTIESDTSPDYPKPPNNTPNSTENQDSSPMVGLVATSHNRILSESQLNSRLERLSHYSTMDMRAIHNAKERKRRSRIRDACQAMRRLLPGVNERTDNASVFEQFANYISFFRMQIGDQYDIDYLRESQLLKDKYQTLNFVK